MQQVADLLGYSRKWVADHLQQYAIDHATGGGSAGTLEEETTRDQVASVVREYAPEEPDGGYVWLSMRPWDVGVS